MKNDYDENAITTVTDLEGPGFWTCGRMVSGIIVILYLGSAFWYWGVGAGLRLLMFLVLPLACIWFPHAMGAYTGPCLTFSRGYVTRESSPDAILIGGWLLLFLPMIVYLMFWYADRHQ